MVENQTKGIQRRERKGKRALKEVRREEESSKKRL